MTKTTICSLLALGLSAVAVADDKAAPPAGGMPDMSKVGPMSRKVTKEDKKGVDELYKASKECMMKADVNAMADLVDFPVIMLSDDSKGEVKHFSATRDVWVTMMKPFFDNMPKDVKMDQKHTAHFLSDDLAVAIEENTISGKMKAKWKSTSILTLRDGKWKFKQMAEAGWGDMKLPAGAKTASNESMNVKK